MYHHFVFMPSQKILGVRPLLMDIFAEVERFPIEVNTQSQHNGGKGRSEKYFGCFKVYVATYLKSLIKQMYLNFDVL